MTENDDIPMKRGLCYENNEVCHSDDRPVDRFCSCQKFKYDNTTVLGQVTAIDGQQVTLLVNEMDMSGNMIPGNFDGGQGNMSGSFFGGFEGMTPPSVSDSGSRS